VAAYIAQICDEIKQVFAGKMKFNVLETFSPHSPYTHQKLETMTLPVPITDKTAELSQRRPRDAPNIWVP